MFTTQIYKKTENIALTDCPKANCKGVLMPPENIIPTCQFGAPFIATNSA